MKPKDREEMPLIGERLRTARIKAGIGQDEAAEAAGVARTTVANWEAGRNLPCLIQLGRLCTLYGTTERRIVRGTSLFSLTAEEGRELLALTVNATASLKRKVDLLLALSIAVS